MTFNTLTDTHCHLYLDNFDDDIDQVLQRASDNGVKRILLPAIDWGSIDLMERLSHSDINFYKMAGIHPCDIANNWPLDEDRLYEKVLSDEFIAAGETGLDYYWNTDFVEEQKQSLRIHCEVAKSAGKPVVLHNRESTGDLLDLIDQQQDGRLSGVWHCFNGSEDEGRRALDLGLYLGIGGVLTFKNAGVDKTIRKLPIDKMILETDAPYLSPVPMRGKRNEPSFIVHTACYLAEVLELPPNVIADITNRNAGRLFNLTA